MSANLNDASFWDGNADYQKMAHAFTSIYAERAWELAALPRDATVLDIAAGAGALALIAARAGNPVLATDFSAGMIDSVLAHALPNLAGRVMDGQALDLPDASFDAAFSMFGIMLFPDWRKGLAEMARVVRPGGLGSVGTWKHTAGAAANLLLANRVTEIYPDVEIPTPVAGMNEWREPGRFRTAMMTAGFTDVTIDEVNNDYPIDRPALAEPMRLFRFSPIWPLLDQGQRTVVLESVLAGVDACGGVLAVPSMALIATARRAG
ncbi:SAM-dependent methyltransferase [Sphingomonas sp. UYAg733]